MSSGVIDSPVTTVVSTAVAARTQVPTGWQVQAWRHFRLNWPIAMSSVIAVLLMQAIATAEWMYRWPKPELDSIVHIFAFAIFSSFLFSMASICNCVGIDREQRFWEWQTALPCGWKSELGFQVMAILVGGVVCFAANLVIASLLDVAFLHRGLDESQPQWLVTFYASSIQFLGLSLPLFFLCFLLIDNVAIAASVALAFMVGYASFRLGAILPPGENYWDTQAAQRLQFQIWILATVLSIVAFGWRWRGGLFSHIHLPTIREVDARAVSIEGQPSFAWVQLVQTLRQTRWTLLLVVGALVFMILLSWGYRFSDSQLALPLIGIPLLSILLGVEVFGGDCAQDQIRFLADRGVSPALLWLYRLGIGLGPGLLVILSMTIVELQDTRLFLATEFSLGKLCVTLLLLSSAVLARLCFRSWVAAFGAVLLFVAASYFIFEMQACAAGLLGMSFVTLSCSFFVLTCSYWAIREHVQAFEPRVRLVFTVFVGLWLFANFAAYPVLNSLDHRVTRRSILVKLTRDLVGPETFDQIPGEKNKRYAEDRDWGEDRSKVGQPRIR